MTAGTELIWKQQLAICTLQWLHCGYHYMINTFHYQKPGAVQYSETKKVGLRNSNSKVVGLVRLLICGLHLFFLIIHRSKYKHWTYINHILHSLHIAYVVLGLQLYVNIDNAGYGNMLIYVEYTIHGNVDIYLQLCRLLLPELQKMKDTAQTQTSKVWVFFKWRPNNLHTL